MRYAIYDIQCNEVGRGCRQISKYDREGNIKDAGKWGRRRSGWRAAWGEIWEDGEVKDTESDSGKQRLLNEKKDLDEWVDNNVEQLGARRKNRTG